MRILLFCVPLFMLASCDSSKDSPKDKSNAKHPPENLGSWVKRTSGVASALNGVSCLFSNVLMAVGNEGVVLVSADQGSTWTKKDLGTKKDLYAIGWVNNVVYIGGDHTVLMSIDNGQTFTAVPAVTGVVRGMDYDSDALWAVGDAGYATKTDLGSDLTKVTPSTLTWSPIDLGVTTNLFGMSLSFGRGIAVGANGTLLSTENKWQTVSVESDRAAGNDLFAADGDNFGGTQIFGSKSSINGAPVGSYSWHVKIGTEQPNVRALFCISNCVAVGTRASDGNAIYELDDDGTVKTVLASGISNALNSIRSVNQGKIAVGEGGLILTLAR